MSLSHLGRASATVVETAMETPFGPAYDTRTPTEPPLIPSFLAGGGCFVTGVWAIENDSMVKRTDYTQADKMTLHDIEKCQYCRLSHKQLPHHDWAAQRGVPSKRRLVVIRQQRWNALLAVRMFVYQLAQRWKRFLLQRQYVGLGFGRKVVAVAPPQRHY